MVHADAVSAMSKVSRAGPGRPKGALNKITRDIRAVIRDLAEGNAHRVQEWLDRVAETDPAEAVRLWVALLRFVTPTLQAASITDLTRSTSVQAQLYAMTNAELDAVLNGRHPPAALIQHGHERDAATCVSASDDELLQ